MGVFGGVARKGELRGIVQSEMFGGTGHGVQLREARELRHMGARR